MFETILGKIITVLTIPVLFVAGLFAPIIEQVPQVETPLAPTLGVALPSGVAVFETSLATGISNSATTMTLTSASIRGGGTLSGFQCFSIDEGSAQAEFVCGTSTGVAITGLTRGISPEDGITELPALKFSHRRGASVKITDFPLIQRLKSQNAGSGTFENPISYASGIGPVANSDLADKEYVLSVVTGGTVSFDAEIVAGTAGETVVAGNLVYLLNTDGRWWKVDTDTESTVKNRLLGIAQGGGTAGVAITGGVLTSGLDTKQSGLTIGTYYYAGATAGAISSTVSGRVVGQARTATQLHFDPAGIASSTALLRFGNNFTGTNSFSATTTFGTSTAVFGSTRAFEIGLNKQIITTTGTSTFGVPTGIKKLWVEAVGAGGQGGNCSAGGTTGSGGGGGGAGGYAQEIVNVSATTTFKVHVGATPGQSTRFGEGIGIFLSATGGASGAETTSGAGGTATGGDLNINGGKGAPGSADSDDASADPNGGMGASTMYGSGGAGASYAGSSVIGNNAVGYGSGGGGAVCSNGSAGASNGTQGIIIVRW